jgi:hypothetical protein
MIYWNHKIIYTPAPASTRLLAPTFKETAQDKETSELEQRRTREARGHEDCIEPFSSDVPRFVLDCCNKSFALFGTSFNLCHIPGDGAATTRSTALQSGAINGP